jgi:ATP-dependent Clp protease ATP-binding subunit ClpC
VVKFSDHARLVLGRAKSEAAKLGSKTADTEHLLLGLMAENECLGALVIRNLGVNLESVRREVLEGVVRGEQALSTHEIQLSPGGKHALELAVEETRVSGKASVGTEHILLGILRESEGTAAKVLLERGIDVDQAREEIRRALP